MDWTQYSRYTYTLQVFKNKINKQHIPIKIIIKKKSQLNPMSSKVRELSIVALIRVKQC